MERGPMALFGAIVAVGLGPALWLGAQFGHSAILPSAPPSVTVDAGRSDVAGGAGGAPGGLDVAATEPASEIVPLSATPSARPSTTGRQQVVESRRATVRPSPSASSGGPSRSAEPPVPSTESTTASTTPTTPSTEEGSGQPTSPVTVPTAGPDGTLGAESVQPAAV